LELVGVASGGGEPPPEFARDTTITDEEQIAEIGG